MTIPSTRIAACLVLLGFVVSCSNERGRGVQRTYHKTNGVYFVEFQADWCGPCQQMKPTVARLKNEFPNVIFDDINVDEDPVLANQYNVSSIPYSFVAVNGIVQKEFFGVTPYDELKQAIERGVQTTESSNPE